VIDAALIATFTTTHCDLIDAATEKI